MKLESQRNNINMELLSLFKIEGLSDFSMDSLLRGQMIKCSPCVLNKFELTKLLHLSIIFPYDDDGSRGYEYGLFVYEKKLWSFNCSCHSLLKPFKHNKMMLAYSWFICNSLSKSVTERLKKIYFCIHLLN